MQDETNEELYNRLFGRGWSWFMLKTAALRELNERSDDGDIEAASYLQLYEDGVHMPKRPRMIVVTSCLLIVVE